jgi:hypothetical protein
MANQRGHPPRTITTPHDRLFHRVLGERDNAIAFFERTLIAL